MLGDTITITIDGSAKALSKINQDSYSAEYFLKESLGDYRLTVRHVKDSVKAGLNKRDRHSLVLVHTIYPVSPAINPVIRQSQLIIVNDYNDDAAAVSKEMVGLEAYGTLANLTKVVNWES